MNKRSVGKDYEEKACEYLQTHGFFILERNFRCRQGEIDIIAREGNYLVFIEVKFRTSTSHGNPLAAVDFRKQKRISRAAAYYLIKNGYPDTTPCRFDVVGILPEGISHIRNAFDFVSF